MKTIFFTLFCGILTLVSCREIDDSGPSEVEATTFTVSVEADTRATSTIEPRRYIMEVWNAEGTAPENVFDGGTKHRMQITMGNTFSAKLDKAKGYTCLFWADDNATYDAASLTSVKINTGKPASDAYYGTMTVPVGGGNRVFAVTLERAVGRMTLIETGNVEAGKQLALTFSNIYPSFDVMTGLPTGQAGTWSTTVTLSGASKTLATVHFFAKREKELVNMQFVCGEYPDRLVTNIPLQMNYATTISGIYCVGSTLVFDLSLDRDWSTPPGEVVVPSQP